MEIDNRAENQLYYNESEILNVAKNVACGI